MSKAEQHQPKFSVEEILLACGGRLVKGSLRAVFSGVSIDSRTIKAEEIFVAVKGDNFDGHNFISHAVAENARCVIISDANAAAAGSNAPECLISVSNTTKALCDLAYFHRKRFGIPVLCITGTNGKTTTKEMLNCLLATRYKVLTSSGNQNNRIGLSLNILKLTCGHDLAVFELGTNHFGEIKELAVIASPSVGIITNIGCGHLEFFGTKDGVLKEKWQLIEELAPPAIAILNADDEKLKNKISLEARDTDKAVFTFGVKNRADICASKIFVRNGRLHFVIKEKEIVLNTLSKINVYNALSAYLAARIFSIDAFDIIKSFEVMELPRSRFQLKNIGGLKVIDDSYNANPDSFQAAIESFSELRALGKKILVIADMLELGKDKEELHKRIGERLSGAKVDAVVGVGRLAHLACERAASLGYNVKSIFKCASNSEAKQILKKIASRYDAVLLKGSRAMRLEEIFE